VNNRFSRLRIRYGFALVGLCCGILAGSPPHAAGASRSARAAERVTPALTKDLRRLDRKIGDPLFIRIFKAEAKLEVWLGGGAKYSLFRTYPICTYSGELGPKLATGDNQAPEGFYTVGASQLNPNSSYHLSFNLGYPNSFDRANGRTGDFLMVHGDCVSIGCYAMGDAAIEEIYTLLSAALSNGQTKVPVHVFPFDFAKTDQKWSDSKWAPFWRDLRLGYRAFVKTKQPPLVSVSEKRYVITPVG
jgi:murein L,D-transpeptidase YafK